MKRKNYINIERGNRIESRHEVEVAVVDSGGRLLYQVGNPHRKIYARSSMKPIQAIPVVETGAADHYGFCDEELSICTASHNGEPMHTARVWSILIRVGFDENMLQCGTHPPRWHDTLKELILNGKEVTPIYNNCSGKHAGMLATAQYLEEPVETYYLPDHPVQQRILRVVSNICEYPLDDIELGVDGCGVPVHRLPLERLAYGFASMSRPEKLSGKRKYAVRRVTDAMISAPEMVGGTNRFCTDFMNAGNGRFFGKAGAEGVYAIGDKENGIGIAVKVKDGNARALYPAVMEVLLQLDLLTEEQTTRLQDYHQPTLKNARKEVIGQVKPDFELQRVGTM